MEFGETSFGPTWNSSRGSRQTLRGICFAAWTWMEAKYTFATMVCLVLVLQHGYGTSLGGPKTLTCNVLRVFTNVQFLL